MGEAKKGLAWLNVKQMLVVLMCRADEHAHGSTDPPILHTPMDTLLRLTLRRERVELGQVQYRHRN